MASFAKIILLASFSTAVTLPAAAQSRKVEETGLAVAFDDEGKSMATLCAEARRNAARKVPKDAKNIKFTSPVFKGRTIRGKPGHNCIVYVSFDLPTVRSIDDDDNPFSKPYQLPTTQPQSSSISDYCNNMCENAHSVVCDSDGRIVRKWSGGITDQLIAKGCPWVP